MKGLLDFLQAASNGVASNVSGPVDLIGAGLNKIGLNVGAAPVGGSEWMKRQGLMRDVQQGPARVLGETAGLLGPAMASHFAPQIAKGLLQVEANAMAPAKLNKEAGAIVWHGSPHKFDKFDASKIGTGEGAQAYGHGLYLAESDEVAKQYRDMLSGKTSAGSALNWDDPSAVASMRLHQFQGDKDAAIQWIAERRPNPKASAANAKAAAHADAQIEAILNGAAHKSVDGGQLYKVDLPDEHIAKMLDWDKPLSQQAPEVQAVIDDWASRNMPQGQIRGSMSGDEFLRFLSAGKKGGGEDVLRKAGIPGIRYLDGGSRGAGGGTSNFVVFPGNEGLLQILERNGQAIK